MDRGQSSVKLAMPHAAMVDLGEATGDSQPAGSTSKVPYEPSRPSGSGLHTHALEESSSPGHGDDQDTTPSPTIRAILRDRSRSASTPSPVLRSAKGKEKASDAPDPVLPRLPRSKQSPRAIQVVPPDPFQRSEMERLRVENDMLQKQLDVLVKRKNVSSSSGLGLFSTEQASVTNEDLRLRMEDLDRKLRTSESQRKRLERELRYLRSYLLSSVEPYRLATPDYDDAEFEQDRYRPVEASSRGQRNHSKEDMLDSLNNPRVETDVRRHSSHKRKQTMGDAETEHLLLASARLRRLRKVVDFHPQSAISHLPQARRVRATPSGAVTQNSTIANEVSSNSLSLPPLPPPWPVNSDMFNGLSSSVSPEHPSLSLQNGLGSPIRTTRVKREAESPQVSFSNAALVFQNTSTLDANIVQAPSMQVSTSATSSGKGGNGERKIGRPLGSPNKTKLVSIHNQTAIRRKARASEIPSTDSGSSRREKPLTEDESSSTHPYIGSTAKSRGETQNPIAVDGLLFAAQRLYGDERDTDLDTDAINQATWLQDEMDIAAFDSPAASHYVPPPTSSQAVPFPPATPASLEEPDMTRFPHVLPTPSRPGLPTTPSRARTVESKRQTLLPPETPNTLARIERSALDVLAEEAASASKDPASLAGIQSFESLGESARNLTIEMEMAGQSPPNSLRGFTKLEYPDADEDRYGIIPDGASQRYHSFLGEPFEPNHQGNTANFDSLQEEALPQPMTIAEQLAQGVDMSHPLIDPEDIQAGMTPAAALAKKSRSPYIKWTVEEDEQLILGVAEHGTKWEAVARMIPSRSYHQCRQRWLRGLKSGEALPANMQHLKPQIEAAVQAHEQARPGPPKKTESRPKPSALCQI